MDLMIKSSFVHTVEKGIVLNVRADDLAVQAYVVIAAADLSLVEQLIPNSVFESGVQVHVGNVTDEGDHLDQVLQILENMDTDDVVVYLCESAGAYVETLSVLGATNLPAQH